MIILTVGTSQEIQASLFPFFSHAPLCHSRFICFTDGNCLHFDSCVRPRARIEQRLRGGSR